MKATLDEQTWPMVSAPTLLIPVGSTEQHGPHLPLGTDTIIAEALAGRAAEELSWVVVGPSITIAASGEHQGFAGTVSIGSEVLSLMLIEIVRSASLWAKQVVFVNGHGGNRDAFTAATKVWVHEDRNVLVWSPQLPVGGDWHAGHVETSVMLVLRPQLVRPASAVGHVDQSADTAHRLRADGIRGVAENGVLGDPTTASREAGVAMLDTWNVDLCATLRDSMST